MTFPDSCRLYAFVDTAYLHERRANDVARQLCDGGADIIQLRGKKSSLEDLKRMAERILPVVRAARVPFVINDYPTVALQVNADCVHLGQEDFWGTGFVRADQITGSPKRIALGLSTHSPEQALDAIAASPDYIAVGPVYATDTKPGRPAVTLEYVRWAAAKVVIPWFAIGGIDLQNIDSVLEAGARRICVVSAILNAPDIARACQQFKKRLASMPL